VLVAALEGDPGQLRDAVDELGDRLTELGRDLIEARARVLDRVVEQRRAERLGVEPQPGADLRDLDGVGDEVLPRLPALVGMALAREREAAFDRRPVDLRRAVGAVLADHREQIAEQRALIGRQLLRDLVDRRDRAAGTLACADPGVAAAIERPGAVGPIYVLFGAWFRYRRASWNRSR
jgi:hypothetical protein